jgi:hypothetical protein
MIIAVIPETAPKKLDYPVTITVRIASKKNKKLKPMVTRKRTFSMPRRAVKIPPVSPPVKPPKPAPLLCKITLAIKAIDVIIKPMSKYNSTINLQTKNEGQMPDPSSRAGLYHR